MMLGKSSMRVAILVSCLFTLPQSAWSAEDDTRAGSGFRGVLETAELGTAVLAEFSDTLDYQIEDWQLLVQLLHRLGQYSTAQQADWALAWSGPLKPLVGDLVDVVGTVESVEILTLPEPIAQTHGVTTLYRCRFRCQICFEGSAEDESARIGTVLSTHIPGGWQDSEAVGEPIGFRGIMLRPSADEPQANVLFLTPRLAWYPCQGVPTGQLLLARNGMDVGLLEEVRHGKPFVGHEVSLEGEAFYGCLAAMHRVDSGELSTLAKQSVAEAADRWRESKSTDRDQRAIAARVQQRSELGLSSVVPLFREPEEMIGRLVRIEGTARRAVRIVVADQPDFDSYFEIEIFAPDSQNLPIVCCVTDLPADFPTGDAIREPVRMTGVFFKGWVYRGREVQSTDGETGRQQRRYTPVVVGAVTWLPRSTSPAGLWGLWGGIAFLVILMVVMLNAVRLARRDQRTRAARRHSDSVELPNNES